MGTKIYMVSLDISKAFDTVDLNVGVTILKSLKLPYHLINRIIKSCFWGKKAVLWYGALSKWANKSIGVKQGCPISPRIFTLILNEVIKTLACEFSMDLNGRYKITLYISLC